MIPSQLRLGLFKNEDLDIGLGLPFHNFNINDWSLFCENLVKFLVIYQSILDSYVLDFYTKNLWNLINSEWRKYFDQITPIELSNFLSREGKLRSKSVLPLSLIAFRATCFSFGFPSSPINPFTGPYLHVKEEIKSGRRTDQFDKDERCNVLTDVLNFGEKWKAATQELSKEGGQHKHLEHIFRKHLKPKKQHEVARMAQLAFNLYHETGADIVVDVGSGQGHLARLIGYGFRIPTICLDAEETFLKGARKFDLELERFIRSRKQGFKAKSEVMPEFEGRSKSFEGMPEGIRHSTCHLNSEMTDTGFSKLLRTTWPELHKDGEFGEEKQVPFVLVGLHCCGDLSPTLIRLFSSMPACRGLILVSCCYMKLSTESHGGIPEGYPMSSFVQGKKSSALSYTAREMACHAIEMYVDKLEKGADDLKVHCFRALLEELIVRQRPDLKHSGLRSVKNAHLLPFKDYVAKAVTRLEGVSFTEEELCSADIDEKQKDWMKVVIFYSLRLMLAPVVETLILLDRLFFLHEQANSKSFIAPIFDPKLSPRNHALIASKGKSTP